MNRPELSVEITAPTDCTAAPADHDLGIEIVNDVLEVPWRDRELFRVAIMPFGFTIEDAIAISSALRERKWFAHALYAADEESDRVVVSIRRPDHLDGDKK